MSPSRLPPRDALAAAAVFVVTAAVATIAWQASGRAVTDIALYRTYGERIANGLVPYGDFGLEYPPGALPALVLPALVTDSLGAYRVVFAAEMAVAGAIGVLLLAAALRRLGRADADRRLALGCRRARPAAARRGDPDAVRPRSGRARHRRAAARPLRPPPRRVARGRDRDRGEALPRRPASAARRGRLARGRRRELAVVLALAVAPVVLAYLPFLLVAPDGVIHSLGRQLGRPLQIESLGAGALLALHHAPGRRSGGRREAAPRT